jgi:hypothetical protein
VCGEGGSGVEDGVNGAIIVVLGKRDPLGSGELLFQVFFFCQVRVAARSRTLASSRVLQPLALGAQ